MKEKILLCCLPYDYSGVPIYSRCLINTFSEMYEFTLLTSGNGDVFEGVTADVLVDRSISNSLMPHKVIKNLIIIARVIREVKPDIVHLNGTMFGLVGRLVSIFFNSKFIFTYHGLPWGQGRQKIFSLLMLLMELFLLNSIKISIVAISKMDLDRLNRITFKPKNISYIPNCAEDFAEKKHFQYMCSSEKFNILNIARFSPQKNFERLFKAFCELPENFTLTLVGLGTDGDDCLKLAEAICGPEKLSQIFFKGLTNDVSSVLTSATIFCLSSDYEGMPLSAIEAMSAGIPIVMPEVGGAAEFSGCGAAVLYKPNTPEALHSAIYKLCNDADLRKEMSAKGRLCYRELFSLDNFKNNMHNLYVSILDS